MQTSFFAPPEESKPDEEPVSPGLKRYAVVRKTYPPRLTPRPSYLFLILKSTFDQKVAYWNRLVNGPRYELVTTIDHTIKRTAAERIRQMFPDETVLENEDI
jgi:hypothetical protein